MRRDRLASALRDQPVTVAGVPPALLGAWVIFGRPAGAETAVPSETNTPTNRPVTRQKTPPTSS